MSSEGKAVTIVMIEDDEGHARLIERNIRRAGVNNELIPFTNGTDALRFLLGADSSGEVSAKKHLLVLLDLNLPDMTGVSILETIKANVHTKRSPVVVLTTTDDAREIQRCYDLGRQRLHHQTGRLRQLRQRYSSARLVLLGDAGPGNAVTRRSARILYIDDDPGLARLVQKTLQSQGFEVEFALSGAAGLLLLQTSHFDVVGLDHHMPGETGLDILPRIRNLPDAPPVVYVTGSDDSHVAVAALKAGAIDYVWKDVQGHFRDLLTEAIVTALEKEQLRRDKEAADREVLAARDRAELLLREVNHRVANSLAIVAALANMQRSTVTDASAKRVIDEMQARILAVAGVHKRLYTSQDVQSVDVRAYLEGLIEELNSSMLIWGSSHSIELQVEPMTLPTDKAVSLRNHRYRTCDQRLQVRLQRQQNGQYPREYDPCW